MLACFHTSHVTVQLYVTDKMGIPKLSFHTSHVTVQPGDFFNEYVEMGVSIHPMLLFNPYIRREEKIHINVSIHPMLLFNSVSYVEQTNRGRFPYIPCYCSTILRSRKMKRNISFHTSHVTVQLFSNIDNHIYAESFHTSHVTVQPYRQKMIQLKEFGFHTSHVTVQLNKKCTNAELKDSFHTSHVTVQRIDIFGYRH